MNNTTLKSMLKDWTDGDIALYKIAISLGICGPDDGTYEQFRALKGEFAGASELGNRLYGVLQALVDLHLIEYAADREQYRWNANVSVAAQNRPSAGTAS